MSLPLTITQPKKILILRLGALGDLIFLLPAVALLRQSFPDAEIHWLVKKPYRSLLKQCSAITQLHSFGGGLKGILKAGRELRAEGFDWVLDYHANLRSGVISLMTRVPDRVGFAKPFNKEGNSLFNPHRVSPDSLRVHKVDRNLFLTRSLPGVSQQAHPRPELHEEPESRAFVEAALEGLPRPIVVMHTGVSAKGEIKRFPESRFIDAARLFKEQSEGSLVFIWGSDSELQQVRRIQKESGLGARALVTDKRLNFPELISLYKRASVFVGVDSGPMHLANVMALPVLAIYGPKSLDIYRPYFEPAFILSKNDEVGCEPCNATHCANPKGRVCIDAIEARELVTELSQILRGRVS